MINILTGPVHSGKTTLLRDTLSVLRGNNLRVDGYLSEAIWENKEFVGYDLVDLKEQTRHLFIRKHGREDWQRIGPFYFLPGTLDAAKKIIRRGKKEDICIVDEVGPLELKGMGVWPALEELLTTPGQNALLVVRDSILKEFIGNFQKHHFVVYDISQNRSPDLFAGSLLRDIEERKKTGQK